MRRTLFRSRIWRPALVRAGLLGAVVPVDNEFAAQWTDGDGVKHTERLPTETAAVNHVARHQYGGLRFHDLRHSYATWLVDDGVPPNMVQRVMGHERSATTLDLYTRRTDNAERILEALNDPDDPSDDDPDDRPSASSLRSDVRSGNAPDAAPRTTKALVSGSRLSL